MAVLKIQDVLTGKLAPILPPKYNLIFVHQFKSFGSTFSYILAKNYRPESLFHINGDNLGEDYRECLNKNGRLHRVVFGHIKLCPELFTDSGWENTLVITLVREPVERLVSYYNYIKTKPNHALHNTVKNMNFSDFIRSDLNVDIKNGQARRLLLSSKVDINNTETVINHISKHITLLLPTTNFEKHLIAFRKYLGWSDIYYRVRNKSHTFITKDSIAKEDICFIKELNKIDYALFEHAERQSELLLSEVKNIKAKLAFFIIKNKVWKKLTK